MKLKVALLTQDRLYGQRIVQRFQDKYSDSIEISQFSNYESATKFLRTTQIHLLLCDGFEVIEPLPRGCRIVYLTDNEILARQKKDSFVKKYQNVDSLKKSLFQILPEEFQPDFNLLGSNQTHILGFISPAGGCGNSTAAAACAMRFAQQHRKVLFIDCGPFSDSRFCFPEATQGMSRLLYGMMSHGTNNLSALLASIICTTPEGVSYIGAAEQAEDMLSVDQEIITSFFDQMVENGQFDWIILDLQLLPGEAMNALLRQCNVLVVTTDGSTRANLSLERFYKYLNNLDERLETNISRKVKILYNRFSSKTGKKFWNTELSELGGIRRIEGSDAAETVRLVAAMQVFDALCP